MDLSHIIGGSAEKPGGVLLFWTSEPALHADSVSRGAFKYHLVVVQLLSVASPPFPGGVAASLVTATPAANEQSAHLLKLQPPAHLFSQPEWASSAELPEVTTAPPERTAFHTL